MNFSNEQLDLSSLPSLESINFIPVEKSYRYVLLIGIGIFALIALGAMGILMSSEPEFSDWIVWLIVFVVIALIILFTVNAIMSHKKMSYAIREKDILFKKGWIRQSTSIIPYNRVQHCEVNQNPIERMFGLSKVKIYTAGGSGSDISIPGILPQTAERIKVIVTQKTILDEEE